MMFYTTVAGWMLHYFYMTAAGKLVGLDADQVAGKFTEMLASPLTMGFWMVVVVAIRYLRLRPRFAERPRESHESHDDRPAGHHGGAGSQQYVHARRKGGPDLLPRTRL